MLDKTPSVSVVMPVYNAEEYLTDVLERMVNQTLKNIEIIVIDDHSKDNTCDVVKEFVNCDPRVILLQTDSNLGAGNARNKGLNSARGEYIIFLDDDDLISYDMLDKLFFEAKRSDTDVLVFGSRFVNWHTKEKIETPWTIRTELLPTKQVFSGNEIEKDFFRAFVWWPWDKFYNRERIIRKGIYFQEMRTSNDLLFTSAQMLIANRIGVYQQVLIEHSILRNESLENTRGKSWSCAIDALMAVKNFLVMNELYKYRKPDYINYVLAFLKWNLETISDDAYYKLYDASVIFISELSIQDEEIFDESLLFFFQDIISLRSTQYLFKTRNHFYRECNKLGPLLSKAEEKVVAVSNSLNSLNMENEMLGKALKMEKQKNENQKDELNNLQNHVKNIESSIIWRSTSILRAMRKRFL